MGPERHPDLHARGGKRRTGRGRAEGVQPDPGSQQHDGLPDDDGAEVAGIETCFEAHREFVLALRPDSEPLFEGSAGHGFWGRELSQ